MPDEKEAIVLMLTKHQLEIIKGWLGYGRRVLVGKNQALVAQRDIALKEENSNTASDKEFVISINDDEIAEIDEMLRYFGG